MSEELPVGWTEVQVEDVLREPVRNGKSARASRNDEGIRTLTLTAVTVGDFSATNTKMTVANPDKVADLWLEPGDIFVQRSNTPDLVGTTRLYKGPRGFAIFPDLLIRVRPTAALMGEYLEAWFQSPTMREYFKTEAKGMAGSMPKISQDTVTGARVPVAPLPEQRRIVAEIEKQFTRLDAAVATLERVKTLLERARASVLKAAVEGRLVPTEAALARAEGREYESGEALLARILVERRARHEVAQEGAKRKKRYKEPQAPETEGLGELPEGWVWATVEQLSLVGTGTTPKRGTARYWIGGTVPWVTSSVVNRRFVNEPSEYVTDIALSETNLTLYPPGTLLVAMYGEGKTRGKCAVTAFATTTNQALAALVPVRTDRTSLEWLRVFMDYNYESLRRASAGGVQPNLNMGIVKAIVLPLPPADEQHRIVAEVDRRLSVLDALTATVDTNLARCARLRQAILKRAFEGRLVSQDPSDEPAAEMLARVKAGGLAERPDSSESRKSDSSQGDPVQLSLLEG